MLGLGIPELLLILVIVVLIFGPGRLSKISGEIGKSIKNFREGVGGKDDEDQPKSPTDEEKKE